MIAKAKGKRDRVSGAPRGRVSRAARDFAAASVRAATRANRRAHRASRLARCAPRRRAAKQKWGVRCLWRKHRTTRVSAGKRHGHKDVYVRDRAASTRAARARVTLATCPTSLGALPCCLPHRNMVCAHAHTKQPLAPCPPSRRARRWSRAARRKVSWPRGLAIRDGASTALPEAHAIVASLRRCLRPC